MSKTEHNPPQKLKPDFIEFSKVQQAYLKEVRTRQFTEFNAVVETVYEEIGILEKILNASPGKYVLRRDCSGVDVLPIDKKKDPASRS